MARDHFISYGWQSEKTGWVFQILFDGQPQVAALARKYSALLEHPGLYQPVPAEALHMTVYIAGFEDDCTEEQILAVADKLAPVLAQIKLPTFLLGQAWLWNGCPCLHVTPDEPLEDLFRVISEFCTKELGRVGHLSDTCRFMPHVTLAYSKEHDQDIMLMKTLSRHAVEGAEIAVPRVTLVKQWIAKDHYNWDILREIPVGQVS